MSDVLCVRLDGRRWRRWLTILVSVPLDGPQHRPLSRFLSLWFLDRRSGREHSLNIRPDAHQRPGIEGRETVRVEWPFIDHVKHRVSLQSRIL